MRYQRPNIHRGRPRRPRSSLALRTTVDGGKARPADCGTSRSHRQTDRRGASNDDTDRSRSPGMPPPLGPRFRSHPRHAAAPCIQTFAPPPNILYKSLFTENSVATQKQYSTSINTNKMQNTTIKSITSTTSSYITISLHLHSDWFLPIL